MKYRLLHLLIFAAVLVSVTKAASLTGLWDGTIQYDDFQVPFRFEIQQKGDTLSAAFFNGEERVTSTGGRISNGAITLNFDHYATRLTATLTDGVIRGSYGGARNGMHEFAARPHHATRASRDKAPDISGVWDLPYESPKGEHAWQLVVQQTGSQVSAAILRVDGDTGSMTGEFRNDRFKLSHFDGARASILEIVPESDGTLEVDLKGFHNPDKHFHAVRLAEAKTNGLPEPTNPNEHTQIKNWNEPLRFSFPDLNGNTVSSTDARFKDKVVIVNVTGSWCPNCHDEAPFLAELYRNYHSQGLEIVALDFEEADQRKDPTRLQAFIKKYGIDYTYLLAGEPSEVLNKVPQAVNLNSWPTTFFIGRDGKVRAIHAGFAAAASGPFNLALKKQTTEQVERLLSENVRASR
jgi:thiol-disulfide isomerase/thioredoxin